MAWEILEGMRAVLRAQGGRIGPNPGFSMLHMSTTVSLQDYNLNEVEMFLSGLTHFKTVLHSRTFMQSEFLTNYRFRTVKDVKHMPKCDAQFFPPAVRPIDSAAAGSAGDASGVGVEGSSMGSSAPSLRGIQVSQSGGFLSAGPNLLCASHAATVAPHASTWPSHT